MVPPSARQVLLSTRMDYKRVLTMWTNYIKNHNHMKHSHNNWNSNQEISFLCFIFIINLVPHFLLKIKLLIQFHVPSLFVVSRSLWFEYKMENLNCMKVSKNMKIVVVSIWLYACIITWNLYFPEESLLNKLGRTLLLRRGSLLGSRALFEAWIGQFRVKFCMGIEDDKQLILVRLQG